MGLLSLVLTIIVGYLLGAIPFAVIVARAHGVDIFTQGSGNPGATNVKRSVGKKAGNTVFLLDFAKGFVAVCWPGLLFSSAESVVPLGVWGLMAAILGHSFSVFMQFRGGKGVATAMGGLLALTPWVLIVGIVVWLVLFYASRYVSLASLGFGVSLPVSAFFLNHSIAILSFLALLAGLIIYRHKANILRLLNGTENRFTKT